MRWRVWWPEFQRIVREVTGMDFQDLPDVDVVGMFEDGLSPLEAVREACDEWSVDFGTDVGLLIR